MKLDTTSYVNMDKFDAEKQAEIKRIPTERLIIKLKAAGKSEEEVENLFVPNFIDFGWVLNKL